MLLILVVILCCATFLRVSAQTIPIVYVQTVMLTKCKGGFLLPSYLPATFQHTLRTQGGNVFFITNIKECEKTFEDAGKVYGKPFYGELHLADIEQQVPGLQIISVITDPNKHDPSRSGSRNPP